MDRKNSKGTILDKILLDDVLQTDKAFGTTIKANDPVVLEKEQDNHIYLETGDHKGFTSTKIGTVINGAQGSFFSAPVICDAGSTTVFNNCEFIQTASNTNALVRINSGAKVCFVNCTFRRFPLTDRARVGTVNTGIACFIALNTTILGEPLVTANNLSFFSDGDSGANALFFNIGPAAATGFWSIGMNNTTPLVPVGGVLSFGVI